jgi:hypothetical protein
MFYFTCTPVAPATTCSGATVNAVGGGNVPDLNLVAMSAAQSAEYAGILFYQNPNDTSSPYISGDNNTNLNGALYFPQAQIQLGGDAKFNVNGVVVADSVALFGNGTVNINGSGGTPAGVSGNGVLVE